MKNTSTKTRKRLRFSLPAVIIASALLIAAAVILAVLLWPPDSAEPPAPSPVPVSEDPGNYIYYAGQRLPVFEKAPLNEYAAEAFSHEDGFIKYDSGTARYGIDVSTHQGEIDWQAVAGSGMDFAIIRLGFRGYGSAGAIHMDKYFTENMEGALAAGLEAGVYFFSQAVSQEEAREEAEFVLAALEDYDISYPVVFDWELIREDTARTDNVTGGELTDFALEFCGVIRRAGYVPAIYFNNEVGYLYYDFDRISKYPLWLAEYKSSPEFYYNFQIWQYSASGAVPGIEGAVDLNISFVDYATANFIFRD